MILKMKTDRLEPGLLTIFRLFLVAQLILMLVNLHVHSARGYLGGNPWIGFTFVVGGTSALLGYLSLPRLERTLDRFYLPLALIFSTVFSLLGQYLFLTSSVSTSGGGSEESAWQLFLFLCVPLVLVGWQYGFKSVVVYCLFTTALDFILVRWTKADYALFEQTYHRLSFIRFISFLMVGYVISRIMQQLRRQRQALEEANRKLERYMTTFEQLTVSLERNRVARELHDTLAHTLSGVAVQLEAVDSLWTSDREQAHDILGHSLQATRDGLTETRKAIQALRATPLEDLGLANAVREYAEAAAGRSGFRLDLDLPDELKGLPIEVEGCFYRVAQEAIENAVRHAGAELVKIRLTRSDSGLCLEVDDDGVGFDPTSLEAGRHFGLQGMRERAGLIHAALEIDSRPGAGTRLTLSWQDESSR
jgi:signal transduction histidine kinase